MTSLLPQVRSLMSEGKGEDAISRALTKLLGKKVTRHQARKLVGDVERADLKQVASAAPVVPFTETLRLDPEAWAIRISARWRMGVEAIIATGKLLLEAKTALPHGAFGTMIETQLPFKERQAQMLMAIASDNRLSNPQYVALLPPSWGTIYDVTRLSDEEFTRAVEAGVIRPDMERRDIDQIRPRPERYMHDTYTSQSSDGSGSPVAENPDDPAALSVQQGLATPATDAEIRDSGNVVKPERQPGAPDGSPVSPGPSEATLMPGGGLAIAHNRIEPSDSLDFFPTPPWATRALMEHVLKRLGRDGHCRSRTALEPACGEGHMAEVLKEYFLSVMAADIADYGYGTGGVDFLHPDSWTNSDWIITNPPFGDNIDKFILKALSLAGTGVAMLVRMQCLETVGRYERIYRDQPPTLISFFAERCPIHKGRWEPEGDTFTAYVWLVWIKGEAPRAPFWIPPGCREALTRPDDAVRFTQRPVAKRGNEATAAEAAE